MEVGACIAGRGREFDIMLGCKYAIEFQNRSYYKHENDVTGR